MVVQIAQRVRDARVAHAPASAGTICHVVHFEDRDVVVSASADDRSRHQI